MIKNLAGRIVGWQMKKNFLKEQEREIYLYAYEILINQTVNLMLSVLIAVLFHAPMPVFVFLICYIPLRSYCGGHHAKTNEGCTAVSVLLLCLVCLAVKYIPAKSFVIIQPGTYFISGLAIMRFAPVEDVNKPLSENEVMHYRRRSRWVWLGETCIGILFYLIKSPIGIVIALSHLIMTVMLCLGVIKNKNLKAVKTKPV